MFGIDGRTWKPRWRGLRHTLKLSPEIENPCCKTANVAASKVKEQRDLSYYNKEFKSKWEELPINLRKHEYKTNIKESKWKRGYRKRKSIWAIWGLLIFWAARRGGGLPGNGFQTHTRTLLHPNSIYQSDRDGVYRNVHVYTRGFFFQGISIPFCPLWVCVLGVNVCFQSQLQWGEIRSLQ